MLLHVLLFFSRGCLVDQLHRSSPELQPYLHAEVSLGVGSALRTTSWQVLNPRPATPAGFDAHVPLTLIGLTLRTSCGHQT